MNAVTLAKATDGNPTNQTGIGMNHGTGEIKFIGGFPIERAMPKRVRQVRRAEYVTGGRVRVCGLRIDARRVAFLDIAGRGGTAWIMQDGNRVPVADSRTVGEWFRFLLDTGAFAGVVFLR